MWRLRAQSADERYNACEMVKRAFESLRGRVPGMMRLEVGIDESRVDYACDVVLVCDFESAAALGAYAANPEHLRVRDELGGIRTHRYQVDYVVCDH
jgi:hypothetical protein